MTHNTYFNRKLARKLAEYILFAVVWLGIFPVVVVVGIYTKLTERKDDANTRGTSVESKIHPKNTQTQSSELQDSGVEYSYIDDEVVGV
mgnify:FL=1